MHWAGYGITGDVDAGVETLYDYWDPLRQWGQFGDRRHRGKMNVAFVDGHAETAQMPVYRSAESLFTNRGDFQRIGLHKGIMDN